MSPFVYWQSASCFGRSVRFATEDRSPDECWRFHKGTIWELLHKRSCIFSLNVCSSSSSSKFYISCRAFPPPELCVASYCVISDPFSIKTVPPAASLSRLHSSMLLSVQSRVQKSSPWCSALTANSYSICILVCGGAQTSCPASCVLLYVVGLGAKLLLSSTERNQLKWVRHLAMFCQNST